MRIAINTIVEESVLNLDKVESFVEKSLKERGIECTNIIDEETNKSVIIAPTKDQKTTQKLLEFMDVFRRFETVPILLILIEISTNTIPNEVSFDNLTKHISSSNRIITYEQINSINTEIDIPLQVSEMMRIIDITAKL